MARGRRALRSNDAGGLCCNGEELLEQESEREQTGNTVTRKLKNLRNRKRLKNNTVGGTDRMGRGNLGQWLVMLRRCDAEAVVYSLC